MKNCLKILPTQVQILPRHETIVDYIEIKINYV